MNITSGMLSGTFPIHDKDNIVQSQRVLKLRSKCKCIACFQLFYEFYIEAINIQFSYFTLYYNTITLTLDLIIFYTLLITDFM